MSQTIRIGKRGALVIPARLRRRYGLEEGAIALLEEAAGGLTVRPAAVLPVEIYTPERKAQFLLENAVDEQDYARCVEEVRRMGLDPKKIPHQRP